MTDRPERDRAERPEAATDGPPERPDEGEEGVTSLIALDALGRAPFSLVLTNGRLPDNPIVYTNTAFEQVTGYARDAAVGRNCRFLQGRDTDPAAVQALRDAVAERREVSLDILNYRADGQPFWNRLMISPISREADASDYFLGVQMRLDDDGQVRPVRRDDHRELERFNSQVREVQHRVKNHLSMIVSMIRLQARKSSAVEEFQDLSRRIEALQLLYEELNSKAGLYGDDDDPISLGAYVSRIANAIAHLDGRRGIRVNIDAGEITMPLEAATRVGLLVSEIMTNALVHAFVGQDKGLVEVSLRAMSNGIVRIQVSDDGVGLPPDVDWPNDGNLGSRIVRELADGLEATIVVTRAATGTIVTIDVPRRVGNTEKEAQYAVGP